jgi:hypothetical protein
LRRILFLRNYGNETPFFGAEKKRDDIPSVFAQRGFYKRIDRGKENGIVSGKILTL